MALAVKTADGTLVDIVSLVSGKLKYKTGDAKSIFEGKRIQEGKKLNDAEIYQYLTDWSNGYVVIKENQ